MIISASMEVKRQMLEHVQLCLPEEACGFLVGVGSTIEKVIPIKNVAHSSTAFRMDAEEQFKALLWQEEHSCDLLAIYHSHPNGPDYPSERDLREFAYPGSPYIIVSFGGRQWRVFGFMIINQGFTDLQLHWK